MRSESDFWMVSPEAIPVRNPMSSLLISSLKRESERER